MIQNVPLLYRFLGDGVARRWVMMFSDSLSCFAESELEFGLHSHTCYISAHI